MRLPKPHSSSSAVSKSTYWRIAGGVLAVSSLALVVRSEILSNWANQPAEAQIQTQTRQVPAELAQPTQSAGSSAKQPLFGLDQPDSATIQQNVNRNADSGEIITSLELVALPTRIGDDRSLRGDPGETIQTKVRVRNVTDKPVMVTSRAIDFILGENGFTPVPVTEEDISNRWSLAKWLTLAPNAVQLDPREIRELAVVIQIPRDALPGGHYAMVTHTPAGYNGNPFTINGESGSAINQQVGTLLYVIVNGDVTENAFIRDVKFPSFSEYGPVPFSFTIDNQSDIHIRPEITVDIHNMFGQQVDSFSIETRNIFPIRSRDFSGEWDKIWGFGRYKATISVVYGLNGAVSQATVFFWLFPITVVLAIVIVTMSLAVIALLVRRHVLHTQTDQSKRIAELEAQLQQQTQQPEQQ